MSAKIRLFSHLFRFGESSCAFEQAIDRSGEWIFLRICGCRHCQSPAGGGQSAGRGCRRAGQDRAEAHGEPAGKRSRRCSPHGSRSNRAARSAGGGSPIRTSSAMSARARIGAACSSATIRLANSGRAMPDGRLRSGIDGGGRPLGHVEAPNRKHTPEAAQLSRARVAENGYQ